MSNDTKLSIKLKYFGLANFKALERYGIQIIAVLLVMYPLPKREKRRDQENSVNYEYINFVFQLTASSIHCRASSPKSNKRIFSLSIVIAGLCSQMKTRLYYN